MALLPTTISLSTLTCIGTPSPTAGWRWRSEVRSTWHRHTGWFPTKFLCLYGLGLTQCGQKRSNERLARSVLVLLASEFEHLREEGPTELAYAGTPVSGLTQHSQGIICQEWARKVLKERHLRPEILDLEPGTCCNGKMRGSSHASYDPLLGVRQTDTKTLCDYDFVMDGRKVKVKSARMAWSPTEGRWNIVFLASGLPTESGLNLPLMISIS